MPAPLGVSFARDPTLKISVLSLPSFKGRLGMGGADRKLKAMLHGMIRNLDLECYNNVPKMFWVVSTLLPENSSLEITSCKIPLLKPATNISTYKYITF